MSKARQLADLGNVYDDGALSHRRMTYNGAMNVWQRGTTADTATNNDYMCDRWQVSFSGLDGNVDWDQETSSTPDGFGYALKVSMDASETSLDAGDRIQIQQPLEGQDLQHIMKGTSSAKKLTVSFWVRSSVTSTYTLELEDTDNARFSNKTYTVDTADTWEYKTIVFDADTTGTFGNDNGASLYVTFWLDAGTNFTGGTFQSDWAAKANDKRIYDTTGWLESTSPTFYITGVQLEVGDTATPFEHRSFGDELARCQRYYCDPNFVSSSTLDGNRILIEGFGSGGIASFDFPVTMRAQPSITIFGEKNSQQGNIRVTNTGLFVGGGNAVATNISGSGFGFVTGMSGLLVSDEVYDCTYKADAEL